MAKVMRDATFIWSIPALVKAGLSMLRSSFVFSDMQGACVDVEERKKINAYFNLDVTSWVDGLYEHLLSPFKLRLSRENWRTSVCQGIMPHQQIMNFVTEKQKLELQRDLDHAEDKVTRSSFHFLHLSFVLLHLIIPLLCMQALQLDLFYAGLVHGACIKVPLTEIWRSHNEMEHSERDTDQFFRAMWKGLKSIMNDWEITAFREVCVM